MVNILNKLKILPSSILVILFTHPTLYVNASSDYSIASFDSSSSLSLSSACNTVYNQAIPSCQPYDFNSLNPCSSLCIQSLQSLQTQAQVSCAGQSMPVNSMLAYFRDGVGVNQLCSVMKSISTTLAAQPSPGSGTASTQTSPVSVPAGAGGVSYATEAAADPTQAEGAALSKGALVAIVVAIVIGSLVMLFVSLMLYRRYYSK